MPTSVDLYYALALPPEKAIEYFKSKGYAFSWNWHDTWQEAHAKAFTVAKVMQADILQDIRSAVQKAIDEGQTLSDFQKELAPVLKAKGWWGKVEAKDLPGYDPAKHGPSDKLVQLGSPWRLRTIYQANLQTAYQAGRYKEQMESVQSRPYWQYTAVLDRVTRPSHAALNGLVFRYDDPFWQSFYPPNDWHCRCRVRNLGEQNLKDRNLSRNLQPAGSPRKTVWSRKRPGSFDRSPFIKILLPASRSPLAWAGPIIRDVPLGNPT